MAHESFEDQDIADYLNEHFVSIKVDREERPDLDKIYQEAARLTGTQGGWPLSVFLTPEQEPFWVGTYFPPDDRYGRPGFPRVLRSVVRTYLGMCTGRGAVTSGAILMTIHSSPGASYHCTRLLGIPDISRLD